MKWTLVRRIAKGVGIWIPTLLLVVAFTLQGIAKFPSGSGWARGFAHWGYPDWFRYSIGVLEVLAGLLLLVPITASVGAILVIGIMWGAVATHLVAGETISPPNEFLPMAIATIVLLARRTEFSRLRERLRATLRRQR